MPRPRQAFLDRVPVQILQPTLACYLLRSVHRNDVQLCLSLCERRLHVQPGLKSLVVRKQVAYARVFHPERGGFLLHESSLLMMVKRVYSPIYVCVNAIKKTGQARLWIISD